MIAPPVPARLLRDARGLAPAHVDAADDVNCLLQVVLTERGDELLALDHRLHLLADAVRAHVLGGGKRLRAAFVAWGYRAAGGTDHAVATQMGAAVELLHAYALLHDDVMDRSDIRRGRPSLHRVLENHHREHAPSDESEWFGVSAAVLAGDLVAVWADELVAELPVDAATLRRVQRIYATLRREAIAGQYLDLWRPDTDDDTIRVALLKSARYSVTHPLALGAALAGLVPPTRLDVALATFGDAVGVAFQLRDDVLGLFGLPSATGKSNLDDVRQGKRTLLVTSAERLAGPAQREVLGDIIGDPTASPAAVETVRRIVASSGALDHVERTIDREVTRALAVLHAVESIEPTTRDALAQLALLAADRHR